MASPPGSTTYGIDPAGLSAVAQDLHFRHDALSQIQSLLDGDLDGLLMGRSGDGWTPLVNIQSALTSAMNSANELAQKVGMYEALTTTDGSKFKQLFGANAGKIDFGLWQSAVKELDSKGFTADKVLAGSNTSVESYMNMLSMDMMAHADDDQLEKLLGDNFKKFDLHAWHNMQHRIENSGMSTAKYVEQFHGNFSALFASHDWKRAFADAHNGKHFSPFHPSTWDDQLHSFNSWTVKNAPSQIRGVLRVESAFGWGVIGGTVGLLKLPALVGGLTWRKIKDVNLMLEDFEDGHFPKILDDFEQSEIEDYATLFMVGKGLSQYAAQLSQLNAMDVMYQVRYEHKPLEDVLVNKAGTVGSAAPQVVLLLATEGGSAAFTESLAAGDDVATALAKGIAAGAAESGANALEFLQHPIEGLDAMAAKIDALGQSAAVAIDQLPTTLLLARVRFLELFGKDIGMRPFQGMSYEDVMELRNIDIEKSLEEYKTTAIPGLERFLPTTLQDQMIEDAERFVKATYGKYDGELLRTGYLTSEGQLRFTGTDTIEKTEFASNQENVFAKKFDLGTVSLHGSPYDMFSGRPGLGGVGMLPTSVDEVAKVIDAIYGEDLRSGTLRGIQLNSCWTGTSEATVAAALADRLGVPVFAPDGLAAGSVHTDILQVIKDGRETTVTVDHIRTRVYFPSDWNRPMLFLQDLPTTDLQSLRPPDFRELDPASIQYNGTNPPPNDLIGSGGTKPTSVDPFDVVRMPNGSLVALDNGQLSLAKELGVDKVNVRLQDSAAKLPEHFLKFNLGTMQYDELVRSLALRGLTVNDLTWGDVIDMGFGK